MDRSSRSGRASTPADPLCPDPEVLAAWVDQGLEAADRARIDTHLAGCDDCRLVVARVVEFQHALAEEAGVASAVAQASDGPGQGSDPRTAAVLPFTRRANRWRVAALVSAAAAALLLAVQVRPVWGPGGASDADSRLADLADAVGQTRTVEARLTGGFRYGPLRAPLRSGGSAVPMDNWTLYAAAGKIREDALQDPSAPNLHALGLAHLVLGNYDDAVQALEDATTETPRNARFPSDLAAAYLARAKALDRPDDLPRALASAERAIAIEDGLEARFNRALALQALYLEDQARQAWDEYLARDASSDWAEDARRHLAALQRSANRRNDLARNNSPPPITDITVEAGLDWLLRYGLPAWADAALAGDAAAASHQHSTLLHYAQQISTASGDPFAASIVPPPPGADVASHAAAVRALSRTLLLIDDDNLTDAKTTLPSACGDMRGPLTAICELERGNFDVLDRQSAAARDRSARVMSDAVTAAALYPQVRAVRLDAFRALFTGDYATARREFERASELALRGKYRIQAGVMAVQLSDLYNVIGSPLESWRWRQQALEATTLPGATTVRYLAWMTTALSLARDANFEASRAFLVPLAAGETRPSLQQVPRLLSQARAALAAGNLTLAGETLNAGLTIVTTSTDPRAALMQSEVLALQGSLAWARRDATAAERAIEAALAGMGPERSARRAAVLLERARLRAAAGSNLEAAQRDIDEATALLQSRGLEGAQPLPADDTQVAFEAAAALVDARPELQGPSGLALNEKLRLLLTGVLPAATAVTAQSLEAIAARLESGTVAVVFLFGDNGLLSWTFSNGAIRFRRLPIERADIERLVSGLAVQLARSPSREEPWKAILAELFDRLLADVPEIRAASELVIVPDGPLRRVPFGALVDRASDAYVFSRAGVRVVPSLTYGFSTRSEPAASSAVLAIGEPEVVGGEAAGLARLPNARAEAAQVARLYPQASMLMGAQATKQAVLAQLPRAGVLHFAGHALGGGSGTPPRLLLAGQVNNPAAALSIADLKDRLHGARVVLAACETAAAARTDRSVGAADLAGAFLRAGARSVVATLWKIDDVGGQQFFTAVHRGLAQGASTADAVAAAQRACVASEACRSHPVTWVGTTVYGVD